VSSLRRLLFVAYFVEVGLLLMLMPWSGFWERNYFVDGWPMLRGVLRNDFVRGAVSGVGLVNLCAAFVDLASLLGRRERSSGGQVVMSSSEEHPTM
jgi:hypothetical protein